MKNNFDNLLKLSFEEWEKMQIQCNTFSQKNPTLRGLKFEL